ncbi:DUF1750-domain-containing protein [Tothia fuscella]|uniref:DUF1750-domain-containing protein n=1 Tax=Tothia fuscella TaxID=1048955 RepID=A0A9P4NL34_9PEZI|nr:DUF1750-domain-containing protein [Tothia fuscella]
MQDPSYGISGNLINHLHLVSSFRFPLQAQYTPEQAVKLLLDAPRIVGHMHPMAWLYMQNPPADGQVFLTWQSPRVKGFASDGYIWADPEATFHHNFGGYTLEICLHRAGFAYGRDQHSATHMRSRYRIINRDPNAQGPELDPLTPNLWVVHYGPNALENRMPIDRIPVPMPIRAIFTERQFIESQGALTRKEFMLRDRPNWPTINLTPRSNQGIYPVVNQGQPGMARPHPQQQQQQFYPQPPGIGAPPAKRQRQNPSSSLQNAVVAGVSHENIINDEEVAELGDYLDHLTPAEISKIRYKQHHEWMEEIFSSVYSISQIVPEELGLGLTGELKVLTDGIFNSPTPKDVLRIPEKDQPGKVQEIPTRGYEKLSPGKQEEFEERMAKYLEKGQAEIEAMKTHHAKVVNDFKRTRTYMSSERKLRDANLPNGTPVEDIVKDVESAFNISIGPREDQTLIEKGGYEEEDKSRVDGSVPPNGQPTFNGAGQPPFANDGDAANLLDQFGSGSYGNTPGGDRVPTPRISRPVSSGAPTPGTTGGPSGSSGQQRGYEAAGDEGADESGMDLIEGMDLDVDLSGLGDGAGDGKAGDDWVMVDGSGPTNTRPAGSAPQAISTSIPTSATPVERTAPAQQTSKPAVSGPSAAALPSSVPGIPSGDPITTNDISGGGGDLFTGDDFVSFDGLDTAGDALADFGDGGDEDDLGLDLGDGAFDEAFHGTEGVGEDGGS